MEGEKPRKSGSGRRSRKGFAWQEYTDSLKAKAAMDDYFAACDADGTLYGEAGVALALGISLKTLRSWKHGEVPGFLDVAEYAYMRIAAEPDHNPVYRDKAMITRSIYLSKQQDFLGYREKSEEGRSVEVNVNFGTNMERSDFD